MESVKQLQVGAPRRLVSIRNGAVLLIALIYSCAGIGSMFRKGDGPREFTFSHNLHVYEEELACVDCHTLDEGADPQSAPGFPTPGQCSLCHDDIDSEADTDHQVSLLFDGESYIQTWPVSLDTEVLFPHKSHARGLGDCAACHSGIETNEDVLQLPQPSMTSCMECHEEQQASNDCSACHSEIDEAWAPDNHALNWERLHGFASQSGSPMQADQCATCHTESKCSTCHAEVAPRDHTLFWNRRGHGINAQFDRDSCKTCHAPDTCASCHESVVPSNHTALWGGTRSTHCIPCHNPLQDQGCATCHTDTTSHFTATPLPADHNLAMNCRLCHGVDVPLPHVDNGDECIGCHL